MKHGGAKAAARKLRGNDLYETPAAAIRALLTTDPHVSAVKRIIWEPCAGKGAISRELRAAGHGVIAQDLVAYPGADEGITSGIDFLMERQAPVDLIVTNPPYKNANEFIRHGLDLGCTVIVLLRLMAIEGAKRSDLIDRHLVRVWAGIERLPMMHRDGYEGPKITGGGVPFAWFVFSPDKRLPGQPIELRRMSWREHPRLAGRMKGTSTCPTQTSKSTPTYLI